MMEIKYRVGDHVRLKKEHACGANEWIIKRTGVEIKLQCVECGRLLLLRRPLFHKNLRKIQDEEGKFIPLVHFCRQEED